MICSGSASRPSNAHRCPARASATGASAGTVISVAYRRRVPRSPSRTASVRLPAGPSVGMSRRLFATRIAQASSPTATAQTSEVRVTRPTWTYVVPHTATSPKNTKTNSSPRPA